MCKGQTKVYKRRNLLHTKFLTLGKNRRDRSIQNNSDIAKHRNAHNKAGQSGSQLKTLTLKLFDKEVYHACSCTGVIDTGRNNSSEYDHNTD